jgi:cytochrome o ubiquinol oxidase subunit IV
MSRDDFSRCLGDYMKTGLLASLLTLGAFAAAISPGLDRPVAIAVISGCGLAQVLVHLRWFLHLDPRSTPREQLLFLLLAGLFVAIMFEGSFWVMNDLGPRMM